MSFKKQFGIQFKVNNVAKTAKVFSFLALDFDYCWTDEISISVKLHIGPGVVLGYFILRFKSWDRLHFNNMYLQTGGEGAMDF